jgi:hypothetical protein
MAYIKISDPNVIDLAAWQQVINVVNQHSDSITAITNNFGSQGTGETNWNGTSDLSHEYDPGSQKIIYGKNKFVTADATFFSSSDNKKHVYYGEVVFADEVSGATSFNASPIVTASLYFSNPTATTSGANLIVTVQAVTESGFTYRVMDSRSTVAAGVPIVATLFYINWMAIGPK